MEEERIFDIQDLIVGQVTAFKLLLLSLRDAAH
jgi:hypothetical protein